jgi:hypothetical protein
MRFQVFGGQLPRSASLCHVRLVLIAPTMDVDIATSPNSTNDVVLDLNHLLSIIGATNSCGDAETQATNVPHASTNQVWQCLEEPCTNVTLRSSTGSDDDHDMEIDDDSILRLVEQCLQKMSTLGTAESVRFLLVHTHFPHAAFAQYMKHATCLKSLIIPARYFVSGCFAHNDLQQPFRSNATLERLQVYTQPEETSLSYILNQLDAHPTLSTLSLIGWTLVAQPLALSRFLSTTTSLRHLELEGYRLQASATRDLVQGLRANRSLEKLSLLGCSFDGEAHHIFFEQYWQSPDESEAAVFMERARKRTIGPRARISLHGSPQIPMLLAIPTTRRRSVARWTRCTCRTRATWPHPCGIHCLLHLPPTHRSFGSARCTLRWGTMLVFGVRSWSLCLIGSFSMNSSWCADQ